MRISLTEARHKKLAECLEYGHQFFTWGLGHKQIPHKRCTFCGLTQADAVEAEWPEVVAMIGGMLAEEVMA